jgi:hypothetical protein
MRILLLVPDGVGVRNFIYTDFLQKRPVGTEITVWCDTVIADLLARENFPYPVMPSPIFPSNAKIETLRRAKQTAELYRNSHKFSNAIYKTYVKPLALHTPKQWLKWIWEQSLLLGKSNDAGVQQLKDQYLNEIRKTDFFHQCKVQLKQNRPDVLFCTHQRSVFAIAPLLAAADLGIPTACFIFSWDNLPKGTLTVQADNYLVWSSYMKEEMQRYYPEISQDKVYITGTPQFTPYFDASLEEARDVFCKKYDLDPKKHLICFSGDDVKTSPYDPVYLSDLAESVNSLNSLGERQFQILFRRCPVDWSDRFDPVLKKFPSLIRVVDPIWYGRDDNFGWDQFIPKREDVALLVNTVMHSDVVINVGSTMAIDFSTLGKPACYIHYNTRNDNTWFVEKIYSYLHFKTMDGLDPVFWINSKEAIPGVIMQAVQDNKAKVEDAKLWHSRIAAHPLEQASQRIWHVLQTISKQ